MEVLYPFASFSLRWFSNRPFPSCPRPLFQREAKCKTIDMNMIIYFQANEIHFYKKGFTLGLVLKVRVWNSENGYCSGLAQLSTKKQHLIINCFVAYLYLTIYILLYCRYHTYFLQLFCSNFVNVVKFVHRLNIWMLSFMCLKYHLYVRHVAIFADTYQTYLVFSVILLGHLSKTWVTKVTLFVRLSCLLSWI